MATRNPDVMEMVRQELERQPGTPSRELFERAKEMDPEIGNLSLQQFHARYPLQAARRAPGEGGAARRRSRKKPRAARGSAEAQGEQKQSRRRRGAGDRDAVRGVFLRFASDFAQAESRQEIVSVLGALDSYVDEVMQASGRS